VSGAAEEVRATSRSVGQDAHQVALRYDKLGEESTGAVREAAASIRQMSADVARVSQRLDGLLATGDAELRVTAQELRATADSLGAVARRLGDPRSILYGPPEGSLGPGEGQALKGGMRWNATVAAARARCVLTACISSGPRDVQRYYVLEDAKSSSTKTEAERKATLLLAPTTVSSFYDTQGIAYSRASGMRRTTNTTAGPSRPAAGSTRCSRLAWNAAAPSAPWRASRARCAASWC
jgi:hypothetical protein